jgi:hypothetical protein
VALITHIDSPGVGVNDRQTGIARRHPPPQLSALCAVHPASAQPIESGHLAFCHVTLLKSDFRPGLGSACERNDRLSSGVGPNLFQGRRATNQCIAAAEVTLKDGHKAPNGCRP